MLLKQNGSVESRLMYIEWICVLPCDTGHDGREEYSSGGIFDFEAMCDVLGPSQSEKKCFQAFQRLSVDFCFISQLVSMAKKKLL